MKISLNMITWNEEQNLPIILALTKPYVDEIVIVDSLSTDHTKDIALRFGAKVIEKKFENHYANQRNICLDNSTGDWIFMLDGDEFPTPDLCAFLNELRVATDYPYDAIVLNRQQFVSGIHTNILPGEEPYDLQFKIFRRHCRWGGEHSEQPTGFRRRQDRKDLSVLHIKSAERGIWKHNENRRMGYPVFPFPKWFQDSFGEEG